MGLDGHGERSVIAFPIAVFSLLSLDRIDEADCQHAADRSRVVHEYQRIYRSRFGGSTEKCWSVIGPVTGGPKGRPLLEAGLGAIEVIGA